MITYDELIEYIKYEPETGKFICLKSRLKKKIGYATGCISTKGYIQIHVMDRTYIAQRLAWLYVHKKWPDLFIDHIDGNKLNNSIVNLREATISQNNQNKFHGWGTSEYLGVSLNKSGRWVAQIRLNGKTKYIGVFDKELEAYEAYLEEKRKIHPFSEIAKLKGA